MFLFSKINAFNFLYSVSYLNSEILKVFVYIGNGSVFFLHKHLNYFGVKNEVEAYFFYFA